MTLLHSNLPVVAAGAAVRPARCIVQRLSISLTYTVVYVCVFSTGTKAAAPAEGAIARNALANIRDSAASSPLLTMDWG